MMKGKPRIKYILSDNSFLFSGDCLSVAKIDSPTIVAFLASNYTCQVNSLENSVSFTFLNNLERTFSLRIKVSIINPPRVIKSGFIKGYLLFEKQNILVETGETSPLLNTFNLIFSMSKLNIGWNINPANSSSFPFDLKIIRADSPSPDYYPYNSFVLNFEVQSSSPNNVKLRVNIDLITDIGAIFLSGSISETLPSYNSNTKVNCRLLTNDDSSRRIQCSEVGQLLIKNTYKIGFKM